MLRGIGRPGAGSWTMRSPVRRDSKRPRWGVCPTNAGCLDPGDLPLGRLLRDRLPHMDHLDPRREHVEPFADILAVMPKACLWHDVQIAAAIGTGVSGIEITPLAWRVLRDAAAAALRLARCGLRLLSWRPTRLRGLILLGSGVIRLRLRHHRIFEPAPNVCFLSFAIRTRRARGALSARRARGALSTRRARGALSARRLHEQIVGAQDRLQFRDDRLRNGGVIGHFRRRSRHARSWHAAP